MRNGKVACKALEGKSVCHLPLSLRAARRNHRLDDGEPRECTKEDIRRILAESKVKRIKLFSE